MYIILNAMNEIIDRLFLFVVINRQRIIFVFKILFFILFTILVYGSYSVYTRNSSLPFFIFLGQNAGKIALIFYLLTIIPGMAKRFGIKNKIIAILKIFRRYFGISMFLLVLIHYFLLRGVNTFFRGIFIVPPPVFEIMGMTAFILLFPMFATSNDLSVRSLGKWWYIIHKLTYIIFWFIFLHTALQRLSIWSILAGTSVTLELISYIYSKISTFKR